MTIRKKVTGLTAIVLATGAVIAFGAGIIGSTIASEQLEKYGDPSSRTVTDENASTRSAMPLGKIVSMLEEQGYTEVYEIEREGGVYEVEARNPKLGRVELYVDAASGETLKREVRE